MKATKRQRLREQRELERLRRSGARCTLCGSTWELTFHPTKTGNKALTCPRCAEMLAGKKSGGSWEAWCVGVKRCQAQVKKDRHKRRSK